MTMAFHWFGYAQYELCTLGLCFC